MKGIMKVYKKKVVIFADYDANNLATRVNDFIETLQFGSELQFSTAPGANGIVYSVMVAYNTYQEA